MYSTALPVTLPGLTDQQRRDLLREAALLSLHDAFAAVPDPRSCHGRRYDLPFLLTCFVAALLCNCTHSEAAGQWCRAQHRLLRRLFGPRRFVCPTGALYRWLFPQLDVQALEVVLATWVQATLVAAPDEPVAVDGKTVRGARTSIQGAPQQLELLHPLQSRNAPASGRGRENKRNPCCPGARAARAAAGESLHG